LYGGSLNGALSINAYGNAVALKQNFTGININPLMKDALDKDVLEGRGNVALDVSTRGDTVDAMKQALSGSASLGLKDGALKGINLAQTFREAKAKISGAQDAALLGAISKGIYSSIETASLHCYSIDHIFAPSCETNDFNEKLYRSYCQTNDALMSICEDLSSHH
jgi:AsmA protein